MIRAIRIFAALVILTFLGRLLRLALLSGVDLADFLSYSTILSNIAAALVLVALALWPSLTYSARFIWIRGVATMSMCAIGLFFIAWISPTPMDALKHAVGPIVVLIDWLHDPPRYLSPTSAFSWLMVPAGYFGYTLVRGVFTGWYPYPFLDPRGDGGYLRVVGFSIVILVGMAVVSLLLARFAFVRRGRGGHVRPPGGRPASAPVDVDEQVPSLVSHRGPALESSGSVSS